MKLLYRVYKHQQINISSPIVLRIVKNSEKEQKTENAIELSGQTKDIKKESDNLAKQIIERARQVQQEILRKTREDVEKILIEVEKESKKN